MKYGFVVWNGTVGGAEQFTASLVQALTGRVGATMVFVTQADPIRQRLNGQKIPYTALGMRRGAEVLLKPRRFAKELTAIAPDGVVLASAGYMPWALRQGGYRGRIVTVEHGELLRELRLPPVQRALRMAQRRLGARATDVQTAVSDYMLQQVHRAPHANETKRLYNGIDVSRFAPSAQRDNSRKANGLTVGFAGRLIEGKGVDHLVAAMARTGPNVRAIIAGDGPCRAELEQRSRDLQVTGRIRFLGAVTDMAGFWRRCDVAVACSDQQLTESFCIAALEAAGCGIPVIATRNGGLQEVVLDGTTGILVPMGDAESIARALERYERNSDLRTLHGRAGCERARAHFTIEQAADGYLAALAV